MAEEAAFYDLGAPTLRVTIPHVPLPSADTLEDLAMPSAATIASQLLRVSHD